MTKKVREKELAGYKAKMIELFQSGETWTCAGVADELNISERCATTIMGELVMEGWIELVPKDNTETSAFLYCLRLR